MAQGWNFFVLVALQTIFCSIEIYAPPTHYIEQVNTAAIIVDQPDHFFL